MHEPRSIYRSSYFNVLTERNNIYGDTGIEFKVANNFGLHQSQFTSTLGKNLWHSFAAAAVRAWDLTAALKVYSFSLFLFQKSFYAIILLYSFFPTQCDILRVLSYNILLKCICFVHNILYNLPGFSFISLIFYIKKSLFALFSCLKSCKNHYRKP